MYPKLRLTSSTAAAAAGPPRSLSRPSGTRMSCSWTQKSNERISMKRPYVATPIGVQDTAAKSSSVRRASSARRASSVSPKRTRISAGVAPDANARYSPRRSKGAGFSPSGHQPRSSSSIPARCCTTSRTVQPGHNDGTDQSAASRSASNDCVLRMHASSRSTVGRLMCVPLVEARFLLRAMDGAGYDSANARRIGCA